MRVRIATENLEHLRADPHLLDKIVSGDESPVYLLDPETRSESKQWLPKAGQRPTKALRGQARKKTMLTVFFDARGVVLTEFNDGIVDTDSYINTLRKLRENVRRKRPFIWRGGGWVNRSRVCHPPRQCQLSHVKQDYRFPLRSGPSGSSTVQS